MEKLQQYEILYYFIIIVLYLFYIDNRIDENKIKNI